ncbi:hypothetical protein LTR85_001708 [Meristemomyces frigidus]|nr:hypothetical protein LTR85_001708 [Meristemomyces frigidus]
MHFLGIAAVTLMSSSLALAAVKKARDEWQPNADSLACLYMTNAYNWLGESQNLCEVGGQCGNTLPDGLTKSVSSAGPPAGMTCFLYDGANCTGTGSPPIVHPGYANLSDPVIYFNKRALSWKCWKYCGFMGTSFSSSTAATTSAPTTSATSVALTTTITPSSAGTSSPVSITNTVGGSTTSSSGTVQGPSPGGETPAVTATVLTHTFADGSTELTTLLIAMPT